MNESDTGESRMNRLTPKIEWKPMAEGMPETYVFTDAEGHEHMRKFCGNVNAAFYALTEENARLRVTLKQQEEIIMRQTAWIQDKQTLASEMLRACEAEQVAESMLSRAIAAIKDAPHSKGCQWWSMRISDPPRCDCWKAAILKELEENRG